MKGRFGRPSGSAMPLVWAHAEYVTLLRSLQDGRVFDMPAQTAQRLRTGRCRLTVCILAIQSQGADHAGRQTTHDTETRAPGLGVHVADLPTKDIEESTRIAFTFYWPDVDHWEGTDFSAEVTSA